jgi:hypothetical protein
LEWRKSYIDLVAMKEFLMQLLPTKFFGNGKCGATATTTTTKLLHFLLCRVHSFELALFQNLAKLATCRATIKLSSTCSVDFFLFALQRKMKGTRESPFL